MPGELHELSVSIGRLQEGVENLRGEVREYKQETTIEHRKVHDIVVATSEAIRNIGRRVDVIEPLAEDYRKKRDEGVGEERVKKWLYGLAASTGGFVVFALGKLSEWWAAISARPHP